MVIKENEIHIKIWMIPIILSLVTSIVVGAMTWASIQEGIARADVAELKNSETRNKVAINTAIIERLGNTVEETKQDLKKFTDRYNQNREADVQMLLKIYEKVKQ